MDGWIDGLIEWVDECKVGGMSNLMNKPKDEKYLDYINEYTILHTNKVRQVVKFFAWAPLIQIRIH